MNYKNHKYADIFPMMDDESFEELKKDIKLNGLIEAVVLFEDKILDGRNRYKACNELGLKPKITTYSGNTPIEYVISLNLKRRHLTQSQKAAVALDVMPMLEEEAEKRMTLGKKLPRVEDTGKATEKAGEIFNVNRKYIQDAKKIKDEKPDEFKEIKTGKKNISEVMKEIKIEKRKEDIAQQKKDIEEGKIELPKGKYEVLVVDPPWAYGTIDSYDPNGFRGGSPYPELTVEELKNMELPSTDSSVLWLWTTHKFIWDARKLLEHWGFEYKALMVWNKEKIGMGKWLRMQCEFCLLGIKGKPTWNLTNERDILTEARRQHSRKPDSFFSMVDKLCVGRKLDYFGREKRKGWDIFGVEKFKKE